MEMARLDINAELEDILSQLRIMEKEQLIAYLEGYKQSIQDLSPPNRGILQVIHQWKVIIQYSSKARLKEGECTMLAEDVLYWNKLLQK